MKETPHPEYTMAPILTDEDLVRPVREPTSAPALPDEDMTFVQQAETARQEAWDLSRAPTFGDLLLHPWSRERQTVLARLVAADIPSPPLTELVQIQRYLEEKVGKEKQVPLGSVVDLNVYLPTAEKVLFLAAHSSEQLMRYRGPNLLRFFDAIASWSEEVIGQEQRDQACLTALQIMSQHESVMAMGQPNSKGGKKDLGN